MRLVLFAYLVGMFGMLVFFLLLWKLNGKQILNTFEVLESIHITVVIIMIINCPHLFSTGNSRNFWPRKDERKTVGYGDKSVSRKPQRASDRHR